VDTRIEVRREDGGSEPPAFGDLLSVQLAVSNTGNLTAESARAELELPPEVEAFEVTPSATTASVTVDPVGGAAGQGRITLSDLPVRPGDVVRLPLRVRTVCPGPGAEVATFTATVSADGIPPFVVTASTALQPAERCGPRFSLEGGGGCRHLGPLDGREGLHPLLAVLIAVAWSARPRRHRARRRSAGLPWIIVLGLWFVGACGDDDGADRGPPAALGDPCPGQPGMVAIPSVRGQPAYCIDQYEGRVATGALGNVVQPEGGDGSTTAVAVSERFRAPTAGVSWHQAAAICRASGKRLCSGVEWQIACGGPNDSTYPYGDAFEPGRCNGFEAHRGAAVPAGSMFERRLDGDRAVADGCVSVFGVYDLSGNLAEWNGEVELGGLQRGLAGGSFRSNRVGLTCRVDQAGEDPATQAETQGVRCCVDAP